MRSILLVEDHAIFASALVRLLRGAGDLEVTLVANTAEEALQLLPGQGFDLAVVDVYLPKMNGITLVALIHSRYPDLPCLMLSGHMLGHYVEAALNAGARGYVLKDNPGAILTAIRKVLMGGTYISKELHNAPRNRSVATRHGNGN
ncbi:MAG TPA: response regulator transcription factor [Anaerolineales bacterium]|nr:response regulator transcription factor [Anaerolineales bacterium]